MTAAPWSLVPGGILVSVRLTPRGGRDAIEGIAHLADGRAVLRARVRAAASEGEANAALSQLFARLLRLPANKIEIVSGATSRIKRIKIAGNGTALDAALSALTMAHRETASS